MKNHSGFITVAGRPNAGKSTLLNCIAGRKVTIVSHRRQTTRSIIQLVSSDENSHIVWLDTPGWQTRHGGALNRALNVAAEWSLHTADVIVFVTAAGDWTATDAALLQRLPADKKIICALNKIDCIADKNALLPMLAALSERAAFAEIVPISAKTGYGVAALMQVCAAQLPQLPRGKPILAEMPEREFFFAELLREKIYHALGDELPYSIGVVADVEETGKILKVAAEIYVERDTQKRILIGHAGATLKRIATTARQAMEKASGRKIYLTSHVRVADWSRDAALLRRMKIGTLQSE